MPHTGPGATSTYKPVTKCLKTFQKMVLNACVYKNARNIVNKKNELNIMVENIVSHIIGVAESWANRDIADVELGLTGYVMFWGDRMGRRGEMVILYIKEHI